MTRREYSWDAEWPFADNYDEEEGTRMARTARQQIIDQVASIYREWDWRFFTEADFDTANENGFTLDLRLDQQEYLNDTDWTRMEGVTLSAEELAKARRLGGEPFSDDQQAEDEATYQREIKLG